MRSLGLLLARAFRQESHQRGGVKWAGQREGRHAAMSGKWFIEALATPGGWKVAAACAGAFRLPLAGILLSDGADLDDDATSRLFTAFRGALLSSEPVGAEGSPPTAAEYNAMDAGRTVWLWAARTGRIAASPLSSRVFPQVLRAQRAGVRRACRIWGINSAAKLELKRQALQAALLQAPWVPGDDRAGPGDARAGPGDDRARRGDHRAGPGNDRAGSWRHDPRHVFWPSVFAHICEVVQVPLPPSPLHPLHPTLACRWRCRVSGDRR